MLSNISPVVWLDRAVRLLAWRKERVRKYQYDQLIKLDGIKFAAEANKYCQEYYGGSIIIKYDPELGAFRLNSVPEYQFTAPARLKYFVNGLGWRGRNLYDEYLLDEINFCDGDVVVESGGNDGDFLLALRELNKKLSIISFEPSPKEYSTLRRNQDAMDFLEKAEAHELALWNVSHERLEFYVKSATADSSIHEIDGASELVEVSTVRLDEFLPRRQYKLLKLEAEGAEPEILEGSIGILDCFQYVSAEVGFERGLPQDSTLPEVSNFLIRNGFSAVKFGRPRNVVLFVNDTTHPASGREARSKISYTSK